MMLYKLGDLLDSNISTEGALSRMVDLHGELLLDVVSEYRQLPDSIIDRYWNTIADADVDDDELIELYKEIKNG